MQAETDRISSEIQKKKEREGRELEQEKIKKMVTYFFHDILDCEELSSCLTCVRVFMPFSLLLQLFGFMSFTSNSVGRRG